MPNTLRRAVDYLEQWLDYQVRITGQPGCVFALAHKGRLFREMALGFADLSKKEKMTPRHRFRVASHSKSFTAAAIMKLREDGRLRLDDPVANYVDGLHPEIANSTILQFLSHGAGIVRDGADAGQWIDERPFANESELLAALRAPPLIAPSTRMKYSNHGYGLLGFVIAAITGEPYNSWIERNILVPLRLHETKPDGPPAKGTPFAKGHSAPYPLGRRVIIPGKNPTNALAAATGFTSTASDLVRFFSTLDPDAKKSLISPTSRRMMLQKQWQDPHSSVEGYYGLGLCLGRSGGWEWAGHGGGFQSAKTFTGYLPGREICFSILTNSIDGLAETWADGVVRILETFFSHGAPSAQTRPWSGRWWTLGGAIDLVPFANRVLVAAPDKLDPFNAASEISTTARDRGVISKSGGYKSHGEPACLLRGKKGAVREVWLGGNRYIAERRIKAEMKRKYESLN